MATGLRAMQAGVNRYYAMHAGAQAKKALDYLAQAAQTDDPAVKAKAAKLARKHLAEITRERHPELAEQIESRILWEEGHRPETWDAERNAPRSEGPSINPNTGAQEFAWPFDQIGEATHKAGLLGKEALYRAGATLGKAFGQDLAAKNLQHYLDGTGENVIVDPERMRSHERIRKLEQQNMDDLQSWLGSQNLHLLADGEVRTLKPFEIRRDFSNQTTKEYGPGTIDEGVKNIIPGGDRGEAGGIDLGLGVGKSYLHSAGNLAVKRDGDTITVNGEIVHTVPDIYNFERRPSSFENNLAANWPADLEKAGRAKSFGLISQWA